MRRSRGSAARARRLGLRSRVPARRGRSHAAAPTAAWDVEAADGSPDPDQPGRRPTRSRRSVDGRRARARRRRGSPPTTGACSTRSPRSSRPSANAPASRRRRRPRRHSGRRTSCAPRCCRPCRTTCARRWPSIKAAASSLRQPDVTWSADDVDEFLGTIEDEADRLERARRQPARHEPPAGRRDRTDGARSCTSKRSSRPRSRASAIARAAVESRRLGIAAARASATPRCSNA